MMDPQWWDRIARMSRPALIQTLVDEARLRLRRDEELDRYADQVIDMKAEVKNLSNKVTQLERESGIQYLVGATQQECLSAWRRIGNNYCGNQRHSPQMIITSDRYSCDGMRGLGSSLRPHQILLVPGWSRGQGAHLVMDRLSQAGIDYSTLCYTPSGEIDRMEHPDSQWGRLDDRYRETHYDPRKDVYRTSYGDELSPYIKMDSKSWEKKSIDRYR